MISLKWLFHACVCSRCLTDILKTEEMDRRWIVGRGGVKRSKYLVPCFLFVEVSYSIHWIRGRSLLSPPIHRLPYSHFFVMNKNDALPSSGTKRNLSFQSLQRDCTSSWVILFSVSFEILSCLCSLWNTIVTLQVGCVCIKAWEFTMGII